jgi:hypothetical protein
MTIQFLESSELPDLFIDAIVVDQDWKLRFMSVWGGEAQIKHLRARLSLETTEDALRNFRLSRTGIDIPSFVRIDRRNLDSMTGRPLGNTLFAHLTHLWVYDRLALLPDTANGRCLLLRRHDEEEAVFQTRIWQAVQTLSRTPLHYSWEDKLMPIFKENHWVMTHQGFGIDACVIDLPEKKIEQSVMYAVCSGQLGLPAVH